MEDRHTKTHLSSEPEPYQPHYTVIHLHLLVTDCIMREESLCLAAVTASERIMSFSMQDENANG